MSSGGIFHSPDLKVKSFSVRLRVPVKYGAHYGELVCEMLSTARYLLFNILFCFRLTFSILDILCKAMAALLKPIWVITERSRTMTYF